MRESVFRHGWRKLVVIGAVLLGVGTHATAYDVTVTPGTTDTTVGSQVAISVLASDLSPGGLGSYNLDLSFEAGVLGFNRVTDGLGMGNAFGLMWGLTGGTLTVTDTSLDDPLSLLATQSPSFVLFTVYFDALSAGTSFLNLSGVVLSDAYGGADMPITLGHGSVTVTSGGGPVTPVPEPGAWVLMLAGVLTLVWLQRRNAAARTRQRTPSALGLPA